MHGIVRRRPPCRLSLSIYLLILDGTPRLRGKFDIFRHGIWRSNDARAKLSTSICLFVPNWPSATPGLRRNWKVSFCSSVLDLSLFPAHLAKFVTYLPIPLSLSLSRRWCT